MNLTRDERWLTRLAGNIYDAGLEPQRWPDVLTEVSHFVGGDACLLVIDSDCGTTGSVCHAFGIDGGNLRLYREIYVARDPTTTLFRDPERIESILDLVSPSSFYETDFFREWFRPQGWIDAASAVLDKATTGSAYFSVMRGPVRGGVDDEMRQSMRLIVPHLRRAVAVERAMMLGRTKAATFADILNNLSAGIFLVDAEGGIVHANAAGCALQHTGDFLRAARRRLIANDGKADQRLREIFAAAGRGEIAGTDKRIAMALTAPSGEHYVAEILPLAAGESRNAGINPAVAALFVRKAEMDTRSPLDLVANAYNLTPAELRVLLAIVDVGGVPNVARTLGIADTTVKTHLNHLFEKTGASRQADLVKLVARFSKPLLG
jgi:DNA-binding CsgD family transcriptional regulator